MENLQQHSDKPTFDSVWALFQETDKKFQDTDKKFEETRKQFEETRQELKERDKQYNKKLNKLEQLFTSQWGKLVESLVEGDLVRMLNEREVKVHDTTMRMRGYLNGKEYEYDIVAENGKEVVVVEVKTTLRVEDVDNFVYSLSKFREVKEKYKDNTVYGAIAYLNLAENADKYAYKKGLFVIKATGNSAKIINDDIFEPNSW